jgi:hypothetical protein
MLLATPSYILKSSILSSASIKDTLYTAIKVRHPNKLVMLAFSFHLSVTSDV